MKHRLAVPAGRAASGPFTVSKAEGPAACALRPSCSSAVFKARWMNSLAGAQLASNEQLGRGHPVTLLQPLKCILARFPVAEAA